ncbi:MAG: chitobiase/beta-hexosaminidase C-terminal domain-containing protein [Bacteroidaceae bacterium]|nr:chitobiase/beta-hexosaminidase C-terminal domain-containing protein [Bacteroidaceae bacterium]
MKHFTRFVTRLMGVFAMLFIAAAAMAEVKTAEITFGSATGSTAINDFVVTGADSQSRTWTMTTVAAEKSFTQNASYSQVGASKKPATSFTASTSCTEDITITSFEVMMGGFSGTAGDIVLKVGDTEVATGALNATEDVTVSKSGLSLSAKDKNLEVSLTNIAKGVKVYYIKYTYTTGGDTPVAVEAPKFNIESGEYDCEQTVAISAEEGAKIYYTIDGTTPDETSTEYTEPFAVAKTTTVKAIAVKGTDKSSVSTLNVTILPAINNIADLKKLATGDKAILSLTDAVVTAAKANTVYFQDATGGICLYDSKSGLGEYAIGDRLTMNGVAVTYSPNKNQPQITIAELDKVSRTAGTAPTGKEVQIDAITAADYGTLVTIKKAHCEELKASAKITQADNTGELTVYTTFLAATQFPAYTDFDITGVLMVYNTTLEILPRTAADFVDNGEQKVTVITVETAKRVIVDQTVSLDATVNSGATLVYKSADDMIATVDADGIVTGMAVGTTTITVSAPAYEGYPAASKEVTITVKAPAVPGVYDFVGWEFPGAESWDSSYKERVVDYDEATVTFASANHQLAGNVIEDRPVTKGQAVTVVLKDTKNDIKTVGAAFQQWNAKEQTITINTSTDGENFEATEFTTDEFGFEGVTLPAGVKAVRFTFSSANNQVGISGIVITYGTTTGIDSLRTEESREAFNLAGQRVSNMRSGLYIIGGKKVVK